MKALTAAGIGAFFGFPASVGRALGRERPPSKGTLGPTELSFSVEERRRPFDVVADNFVALSDAFEGDGGGDYDVLAPSPEDNPGRAATGEGALTVTGDAPYCALFRSEASQAAPYSAVVADVESFGGSAGTVFAGLLKDESEYVLAFYDGAESTAGIEVSVDGDVRTLGVEDADLGAPFRFAFVLNENRVTALVDAGDGFRPLTEANVREFVDMRKPAALKEFEDGFGARSSAAGSVTFDRVTAGYWGEAGLRDPHAVTRADGTPYIENGKLYLTFTHAGLGFFEKAHWGVWTLDLSSYELEQVGNPFFERRGLIFGDHAGHVVFDESEERFVLLTSTWGDFATDGDGVDVHYAELPGSEDVLHGARVVETEKLPLPTDSLPTAAADQWDPHVVRIEGRWYVAFVNAYDFDPFSFYPALAASDEGGGSSRNSLSSARTETSDRPKGR